jgi:hypothetical protein
MELVRSVRVTPRHVLRPESDIGVGAGAARSVPDATGDRPPKRLAPYRARFQMKFQPQ